MKKNIKHIFFDLDRTLWDFESNSKRALELMYADYSLADLFQSFESFHHSYKNVNSDLWKKYGKQKISKEELRDTRFLKTLEKHKVLNATLAAKLSKSYLDLSPKQTQLFPNTLETLFELKNRNYKLHIITNGFQEVQHIKLEKSKLSSYFDIIVCSEHVGFNKPDKRIFHHALDLAKATAFESMMVGDDLEVDVLGANQLGMEAVLFDPYQRHRSKSFQVLNDIKELLDIL